jgi:hypothetical protein
VYIIPFQRLVMLFDGFPWAYLPMYVHWKKHSKCSRYIKHIFCVSMREMHHTYKTSFIS